MKKISSADVFSHRRPSARLHPQPVAPKPRTPAVSRSSTVRQSIARLEDWSEYTCFVIASGPSVQLEDIEKIQKWRSESPKERKVIVTNTAFQYALWADVLLFHDVQWWRKYGEEVLQKFQGTIYSINSVSNTRVQKIDKKTAPLVGNAGAAAIGLCVYMGSKDIQAIGIDCKYSGKKRHFHGDHPKGLGNAVTIGKKPEKFIEHFEKIAKYAKEKGASVKNLSRDTVLKCFPRGSLEDHLTSKRMKKYREHFLTEICQQNSLKHAVELGVWKGRTFLHLLVHCPDLKVTGVDAWKYRPENTGVTGGETYNNWDMPGLEKYVSERAKPFGERAQILKMETIEAAALFEDESIDLVFIDADHSESGVSKDIDTWSPKVKKGGFITGHDIDWPTVRQIVEKRFPNYQKGPDNVWWIKK